MKTAGALLNEWFYVIMATAWCMIGIFVLIGALALTRTVYTVLIINVVTLCFAKAADENKDRKSNG